LLNYEEVNIPTFNFITGKKEYKNKLKLSQNGILIIEGLHSLNDNLTSTISSDKKYKIYMSPLTSINLDNHNRLSTSDNRLIRRIVRDNQKRGYNASETLDQWKRVRSGETNFVFPYQDSADIVVNTSLIYEMSVLKVYAEPLLFSVKENDPNYVEAIRLINQLRMILPMPGSSIPLDSIIREFIGNSCFEE
jgi:uridine kinase